MEESSRALAGEALAMNVADRPRLSTQQAAELARSNYGVSGELSELPSERDQNFRIANGEGSWVLKIAHPAEDEQILDLQIAALGHLATGPAPELFPKLVPTVSGQRSGAWEHGGGRSWVRLVTYLPGRPIATVETPSAGLLRDVGKRLAEMDRRLESFVHPAMHRAFVWDAKSAFHAVRQRLGRIVDLERRELVERLARTAEKRVVPHFAQLPMQVIHNDVNDYNLLVEGDRVGGIIDFGDMVHSYRICELAHALAYLLMECDDLERVTRLVVEGYRSRVDPTPEELLALPSFVVLRLCLSVCMAADQRSQDADNEYLSISEAPAWQLLERLDGAEGEGLLAAVKLQPRSSRPVRSSADLVEARKRWLSGTLSTSYRQPLKIVRGAGQYLLDESGRRYLDCVNNVCHVGHCHPRVVAAGREQLARLNTNTRFLHDNLVEYARRLTGLLPDPLSVCFFVNSGSEANDLALRLARTHTAAVDMVVIDHSYHGHTQSLIDVSPYKYDGQGGQGQPATTHKIPAPDRYRGPHGYGDQDAGARYARAVGEALQEIERAGRKPAGFIAESILGVAGQIELPPGFLREAYRQVRGAGGVCIADEVQVGFGRVGTDLWAFQAHDVVPDIVTLGKPIGNGHPLAAVVTTPEIAASFENGMEYFNTFGGNPVSCAIGLAVLDVIEAEGLQQHAADVGAYFLERLNELAQRQPLIGDIRGRGLFIGIELVRDAETREPATQEAAAIIERMKEHGILVSTDGPFACVLKIKPPLVFTRANVDQFVAGLDAALGA